MTNISTYVTQEILSSVLFEFLRLKKTHTFKIIIAIIQFMFLMIQKNNVYIIN